MFYLCVTSSKNLGYENIRWKFTYMNGTSILCYKSTRLLGGKHVYWIGINADIDYFVSKNGSTCPYFQHMQLKEKLIIYDIPERPLEVIGAVLSLYNKNYLYIDYHSKFLVIKKTEGLSADSLILTCKVFFFFQSIGCSRK